jgi:CHAT domain-containing protein
MFIAGVPATVVSQWKVESAPTRDLMVNFHRMRNPETSHPFYWAGFVLVGDGG